MILQQLRSHSFTKTLYVALQVKRNRNAFSRNTIRILSEDESNTLHAKKSGIKLRKNKQLEPEQNVYNSKWKNWSVQKSVGGPNVEKRRKLLDEGKFVLPEHIIYQQLREGDDNLRRLTTEAKSSKRQRKKELILLEGAPLIREAFNSDVRITDIFFSKIEHLQTLPLDNVNTGEGRQINFHKVNYNYLKIWSEETTCSGITAFAMKPSDQHLSLLSQTERIPVTLICDKVKDTLSLGSLIQTAAAIGCQKVMTMRGCAHIWDASVLRYGSGAHFHLSFLPDATWNTIGSYITPRAHVFMTDLQTHDDLSRSKGHKAKDKLYKLVAELPESETFTKTDQDTGESVTVDMSYSNKDTLGIYRHLLTDTTSYSTPTYTPNIDIKQHATSRDISRQIASANHEVVVIATDQSEGFSDEAYKLLFDRDGTRIHVPTVPGTSPLNGTVVNSVVLCEVKRQFDALKEVD